MSGKKYEPPVARNLSGMSARGQEGVLGTCAPGGAPFADCQQGAVFNANCNTGAFDAGSANCQAGGSPEGSTCFTVGSTADTTCSAGTLA